MNYVLLLGENVQSLGAQSEQAAGLASKVGVPIGVAQVTGWG